MKFPMKNEKYMLKNCMLIMHMHFLRYLSLAFLLQYIAKKSMTSIFYLQYQSTFCMGWTRAGLGMTWSCHTRAQAGWAEGGQAQVQPKYLLGSVLLGMFKQLIGLATAGTCLSTWLGRPNRACPSRNVGKLKGVGITWASPSSAHVGLCG